MDKKVYIVCELTDDICIGTVEQLLDGRHSKGMWECCKSIQEIIKEMIYDECFDDDSISFTIELR